MLRIVDIRKLHHKISCIAVAIGVFWYYFPFWHLPKILAAKYIRYSPPVKVNEYSSYIWTNGSVLTLPRPQRSLWMVKWYRLILNAPARGQWKLKDDIMDGWDPCLSHVVAQPCYSWESWKIAGLSTNRWQRIESFWFLFQSSGQKPLPLMPPMKIRHIYSHGPRCREYGSLILTCPSAWPGYRAHIGGGDSRCHRGHFWKRWEA